VIQAVSILKGDMGMTESNHKLNPEQLADRLQHLTSLSIALSSTHNSDELLERILQTAKSITGADGGTLYRVSNDGQFLNFDLAFNDSLGLAVGGRHSSAAEMPPIHLFEGDGSENLHAVGAYCANRKISVNLAHVYENTDFNFSEMRKFDAFYDYHCHSLLSVPMKNHQDDVIAVLQLINAMDDQSKKARAFSETDQIFIEALASQAAIVLNQQELINQLEHLFESLVNLINIGIDEKSPNTGRHCQHVPKLTMLLAEAVDRNQIGPLRDFKMSEKDRRELWMAGLLHDCGKITTPVHVIEKATKLQTIFDRIELIDTRFEILKRDAEIAALKNQISHEQFQSRLHELDQQREFIRTINIGKERMSDEEVAQVLMIAQTTWINTQAETSAFLSSDEIENLCIRGGTLTAAERQIINNHISVTIRMLEALPWPKHLCHVAEYAGGHHERMDGRGYPKGLRGDQMSLQARMMAIADIFEALSARDRPYKPGKNLSECLDIMGKFSLNGHIDPDLFKVFVREKVYLDYAKCYMDPSQIDYIDESKIPGYTSELE
jgi:HD-GYP domain-containing protein (c-di-GMP phosphodiesterase class II)